MDIGKSKTVSEREEQGTTVHLKDENGEPMYEGEGDSKRPVTITVVGSYSKTYRRARDKQRDRNLKRGRGGLSAETLSRQEVEVIADCITGWDGFVSGDKVFEFTRDNAIMLLEDATWIREQVEEAMGDHQGFSTARSQN